MVQIYSVVGQKGGLGKSMVARRNQKRELLNNNKDLFKALRDANVPITGSNESGDSE